MWQLFKSLMDNFQLQKFCKISLMCWILLLAFSGFSKQDTSNLNPIFRDSVLTQKVDSSKWSSIIHKMDIHKSSNKKMMIQKQKKLLSNNIFLYVFSVIVFLLLLMRLLFDDFSVSLIEGTFSFKQFYLFFQSKKYDSFIAIIFIYILNIFSISFITYIGLAYFLKHNFIDFDLLFLMKVLVLITLFFVIKNIIEFIFNWVINTLHIFKAFFLQNLFAELVGSIVLLILLLVFIYNQHINTVFFTTTIIFFAVVYVVFNTIRSYQLIGNVRIPYKLHFFLYICAFKILPVLLLVKYILNNVVA